MGLSACKQEPVCVVLVDMFISSRWGASLRMPDHDASVLDGLLHGCDHYWLRNLVLNWIRCFTCKCVEAAAVYLNLLGSIGVPASHRLWQKEAPRPCGTHAKLLGFAPGLAECSMFRHPCAIVYFTKSAGQVSLPRRALCATSNQGQVSLLAGKATSTVWPACVQHRHVEGGHVATKPTARNTPPWAAHLTQHALCIYPCSLYFKHQVA